MHTFLMVVHITACLFLILVVLLQAGRGAGLAVFGGGGDAVFASPSGSTFLKQLTGIMAGTFAVTSLMLTILSSRGGMKSVTSKGPALPEPPAAEASAQPGPAKAPAVPGAKK